MCPEERPFSTTLFNQMESLSASTPFDAVNPPNEAPVRLKIFKTPLKIFLVWVLPD